MESFKEVEARTPRDKDGNYKRKQGDWDTREGCVRPMTSLREIEPFTVIHKVSLIEKTQVQHFLTNTLTQVY